MIGTIENLFELILIGACLSFGWHGVAWLWRK